MYFKDNPDFEKHWGSDDSSDFTCCWQNIHKVCKFAENNKG